MPQMPSALNSAGGILNKKGALARAVTAKVPSSAPQAPSTRARRIVAAALEVFQFGKAVAGYGSQHDDQKAQDSV
jgi:hypothetical protein